VHAVAAILVGVLALGFPGCAVEDDFVGGDALRSLEQQAGGDVLFAGSSYAELPLTHAQKAGDRVLFVYGSCEVEDPDGFFGPEGGSCSPPVQIQVFAWNAGHWARAVGCTRRPSVRGAPVVRHDGLVVFTGRLAVKVYARSPREQRAVLGALRSLDGSVGSTGDLPPPAFDIEPGLANCR
jgi:hypothetical protein